MFLNPHHFQQWDRYYESLLNFRLKSTSPLYWGLVEIDINREGLENGTFTLLSCRGIFPGGLCIDVPDSDEAPLGRAIEDHFDPSLEALDVYLAVPADRPGLINFKIDEEDRPVESRYQRDFVRVVDESTGDNEQEIPVARKSFKILFAGESLDGYDYLKIAELERKSNGAIALKEDYIPPCITISASHRLISITRRITEVLTAKSDELREQCRERGDGFYEFGAADISTLCLLQTINSFIPKINYIYSTGRVHPEEAFRIISQLAGALTAFSSRIRPISLPRYEHEDLSHAFDELDTVIKELLRVSSSTTSYVLIPLDETKESIYESSIPDYLLSSSYHFYLAVKGQGDQGDLIREIQRRAKVSSSNDIDLLIGRALRGIALNNILSPPTAIPRKTGYCYFALDPESDFWDDVLKTKNLTIYIPSTLGELQLEFMALEE